jgi:hypothetical protein
MGPDWGNAQSESWAAELLDGVVEGLPFGERIDLQPGRRLTAGSPEGRVVVDDIVGDGKAFQRQSTILSQSGLPFPCVETGSLPIPINLESLSEFGGEGQGLGSARAVQARGKWLNLRVGAHPVSAAKEFFRAGLQDFVRTRIGASRGAGYGTVSEPPDGPPDESSAAETFPFEVHTVSNGLIAYCSPAYFVRPVVFGNVLSTPVSGELDPGLYVCGAGAPGAQPMFDVHARYDVPPATTAHLGY